MQANLNDMENEMFDKTKSKRVKHVCLLFMEQIEEPVKVYITKELANCVVIGLSQLNVIARRVPRPYFSFVRRHVLY